jgi:hypothetical protein
MKTQLKSNTQKLGFEENSPIVHQTKTQGLGSFKQVPTTQTPTEQWELNSHFKILTQKSQEHEFSILPQNDQWKCRSEYKDHVFEDGLKIGPLDLRRSWFFYGKTYENCEGGEKN